MPLTDPLRTKEKHGYNSDLIKLLEGMFELCETVCLY